ncbi:hypothetical protein DL765_007344 [Monosporascus sp. GIB2]|nr:hypothetical protein DL765_007344 [Monosporascus sp. GIB2]
MVSPSSPAALPPDENRDPTIDAIAWVGCVIATVFIALRLYSRTFVTQSLDCDDAIVAFGGILNIITIALSSVSIHCGVRQEVQNERLKIEWKPTSQMPADGFTKILPKQKFHQFVKQLGMVDISPLIEKASQPTDYHEAIAHEQ